jgi:Ca2+-binding EF-hand superfamily protein
MLEKYLGKLFSIGDSNGDGVLQPQEFLELLTRCGLRFPAEVVLDIFLKADVNGDGVIEYDEFIPAMKAIIAGAKEATSSGSEMPSIEDVPPAMLERYFQKLFAVADVNGDGVLQPSEFKRLLELSGFNFDKATVRKLLNAADVNQDGVIEYDEFVPVAMEILKSKIGTTSRRTAKVKPAPTAPVTRRAPAPPPQAAKAKPAQASVSQRAAKVTPSYPPPARYNPPQRAAKPKVLQKKDDVASLEGRVLAVQSRRIIRSKIKELFTRLDIDQDGRLTVSELASAFGDGMARRIEVTLDRNHDGRVTQYEMRRFFDDECSKAVESGVPEFKYLEGIVEMLESTY